MLKIHEIEVSLGAEKLLLTNQRIAYWEKYKMLILSDLHLGKSAHFRKNGIAIPTAVSQKDMSRLAELIAYYLPEHIMVVGDFIHAGTNVEVTMFKAFTVSHPHITFSLVKGNHDRVKLSLLHEIGFENISTSLKLDDITFVHEHIDKASNGFVISGHLHPGVELPIMGKRKLKLPAFVKNDKQLILPAFSLFTGLDTQKTFENPIYYPFNEEGIFELSNLYK